MLWIYSFIFLRRNNSFVSQLWLNIITIFVINIILLLIIIIIHIIFSHLLRDLLKLLISIIHYLARFIFNLVAVADVVVIFFLLFINIFVLFLLFVYFIIFKINIVFVIIIIIKKIWWVEISDFYVILAIRPFLLYIIPRKQYFLFFIILLRSS